MSIENDNYCPEEPLYYNYDIKQKLNQNVEPLFVDTDEYSSIIIIAYRVNTNGKFPFLEYMLINNSFDNKLELPTLSLFNSLNKHNLLSYSKVYLSNFISVTNFENFNETVNFSGFYELNSRLYLFFDITACDYMLDETYSSSICRFAISDEIINHKNVCNIPVDEETIDFFIKNDFVNYLKDKNNESYEIPIIGFVGKSTPAKLNFTHTFGQTVSDKTKILGPYYYFTNFQKAIRKGGWSKNYEEEKVFNAIITEKNNGKYIKGGIVRFALFMGRTKCIENMPNDPIDESEIKQSMLNDTSRNKNFEIQTLRISDHDGNWTNEYDSAYLGNIELDDGNLLKNTPIYVIKDYNQQIPLTKHYINKNTLDNIFDENKLTYCIV
jgi:hypothetical protein